MIVDHEPTNGDSQSPFVAAMSARVRSRAEELNIKKMALADLAGINRKSMTNYWPGGRPYPIENVPALAAALDTDVEWLLTGVSSRAAPEPFLRADWSTVPLRNQLDQPPCENSGLIEVEEVDLAYGMGASFAENLSPTRTHLLPRKFLATITNSPLDQLTIARGVGDSMTPTLQDGDMVLIDRSQRDVREQDGIWAFHVGDLAMIKRLRVRARCVYLLSDNERVPQDEALQEEINIVGRVIFIGRKI